MIQIKSSVLRSLILSFRKIDGCIDFIFLQSLNSLASDVSMGTGYDNVSFSLWISKQVYVKRNLSSPMHDHFGFKVIFLFDRLLTWAKEIRLFNPWLGRIEIDSNHSQSYFCAS